MRLVGALFACSLLWQLNLNKDLIKLVFNESFGADAALCKGPAPTAGIAGLFLLSLTKVIKALQYIWMCVTEQLIFSVNLTMYFINLAENVNTVSSVSLMIRKGYKRIKGQVFALHCMRTSSPFHLFSLPFQVIFCGRNLSKLSQVAAAWIWIFDSPHISPLRVVKY